MARLIVLFGPPATGKSTYIEELKQDYPNAQTISIDKDVISNFFSPKLDRAQDKAKGLAPSDIVWKTSEHLISMILGDFRDLLGKEVDDGEDELVVFIQGVTSGGVESDIVTFLKNGFDVEFILLTAENAEILHRRIARRAKTPGFVGAPEMPEVELEGFRVRTSAYFQDILKGLKAQWLGSTSLNSFTGGAIPTNLRFFEDPQYKNQITCKVALTRRADQKLSLASLKDAEVESHLFIEDFEGAEIRIEDSGKVKLHASDGTTFYLP